MLEIDLQILKLTFAHNFDEKKSVVFTYFVQNMCDFFYLDVENVKQPAEIGYRNASLQPILDRITDWHLPKLLSLFVIDIILKCAIKFIERFLR